jgi:CRP-like cAMP-binding protein
VFDGGNYPASIAAIGDATLLCVSKQDFQALCLAHPQVALKVLRVAGAGLRRLVGIIEELSFTTVRHRLASFLLRLAQREGKRPLKVFWCNESASFVTTVLSWVITRRTCRQSHNHRASPHLDLAYVTGRLLLGDGLFQAYVQ